MTRYKRLLKKFTNLDVTTATVNSLFVLHGELDNQSLAAIAELVEFGGQGIEASVLGSLNALISFLI